jgi:hypothetical protein
MEWCVSNNGSLTIKSNREGRDVEQE